MKDEMVHTFLRHKVAFLILFSISALQAQVIHSNSTLSLTLNRSPLRSVLDNISEITDTRFVYSDHLVDGKEVTCDLTNVPIEESLRHIFSQTDVDYAILPSELVVLYDKPLEVERSSTPERGNPSDTTEPFIPTDFTPPSLQTDVEPDYPREARKKGYEGSVEMNLLVGVNGEVREARVVTSSGHDILDETALQLARKLRYNPARREGEPIEIWVSREMHFELVDKSYLPEEYVQKAKNLSIVAALSRGRAKTNVLTQLLQCHEDFAQFLTKKTELDYNCFVKKIVKPELYDKWDAFRNDYPLHFLVFHDFIKQHPNSDLTLKAKNSMFYFINKNLLRLKEQKISDQQKEILKNRYIQNVYRFIENEYPEAFITGRFEDLLNEFVSL